MVGILIIDFKESYGGESRLVVSAVAWEDGIKNFLHALLAELDKGSENVLNRWDPSNLVITYEPYKTAKDILMRKGP